MASNLIKRIAVFTSGGDAPGMNAAIRAVVRTAAHHKLHIFGINNGYEGMIDGDMRRLDIRDVGNIIYRGGTILKTARSQRFMTAEGRRSAYEALQAFDVDACIAIGGNGTFTGAQVFSEEYNIPIIGVPGTIDNDLYGTDYTIGFDTAVNTAVQALDKIRDTADSHNRLFFVEVMGRNSGFIALSTGIASGAGNVLIPEVDTSMERLIELLRLGVKRKKMFGIVVVAEGNKLGTTHEIARQVNDAIDFYDTKVTIIGHMQRGGSPSALDRLLASRLGFGAVEGLIEGHRNEMIGLVNYEVVFTPFYDAITKEKKPNQNLVRMAEILAI
jgi:6-phosphofructokinase 1